MSYQSYTWATIRSRLKEKWESVPFWTDEDALVAFNEALKVWNLATGQWKRKVTLPTTAGTVFYAVPSTLVYQLRMDFNGYVMRPGSIHSLDKLLPRWQSDTTATGSGVPTRPAVFAPVGLNLFAVWPADAAGANSLSIGGVRAAPASAAEGDFSDCGEEGLSALLGMALHVAAFKEGGVRHQATARLYQQFLLAAYDKNARLRASTFFRKHMGLDLRERPVRIPGVAPPSAPQTGA